MWPDVNRPLPKTNELKEKNSADLRPLGRFISANPTSGSPETTPPLDFPIHSHSGVLTDARFNARFVSKCYVRIRGFVRYRLSFHHGNGSRKARKRRYSVFDRNFVRRRSARRVRLNGQTKSPACSA